MNFSWELYHKLPIIGILRNTSAKLIKQILTVYRDAGFTNIEITMETPQAKELIKEAITSFGSSLNIGAGTVCTENQLNAALEAGACFIVTPIVNKGVIERCVLQKVPIFPGAFTPTEIFLAWSAGATMVKIFPASLLGA